ILPPFRVIASEIEVQLRIEYKSDTTCNHIPADFKLKEPQQTAFSHALSVFDKKGPVSRTCKLVRMLDHASNLCTCSMQCKKSLKSRWYSFRLRDSAKSKGMPVSLEKLVGLANVLSHIGRYVGPYLVPSVRQSKDIVRQIAIFNQFSSANERIVS